MNNRRWSFEATGTRWTIDAELPLDQTSEDLFEDIKKKVELFEQRYSRFRKGSIPDLLSQKSGEYLLTAEDKKLFDIYNQFYYLTGGKFTPLSGGLLEDLGYDKNYSLKEKDGVEKVPKWGEKIEYNWPKLKTKDLIRMDFGAAGKGYIIDLVAEFLESKNVTNYCVEAGGDMRISSKNKGLKIGLENPDDISQVIGVTKINKGAICASAGNRRRWGKHHHIVDPYDFKSPDNILGVWVIASEALIADAISTAIFFVHPERLRGEFNFEYIKLNPNFRVEKSPGFEVELFNK